MKSRQKRNTQSQPDLLDEAKQFLKDNKYEMKLIENEARFKDLSQEEKQKLIYFRKNQMKKPEVRAVLFQNAAIKSEPCLSKQTPISILKYEQEVNRISFAKSQDERIQLLKQYRETMETFTFKGFLQTLYEAGIFEGIFQAIFEILKQEPTIHHQKSLLLQACLFYDASGVDLNQELISEVLSEFKFMDGELNQCLGFLQLLYKNNSAAFSQLKLAQVLQLEQDMPMLPIQVCNFLKGFLSPYLKPFFIPSLTCLTPPIISSIQENGGKAIFKDVPMEFIEDYVSIIIHSFESKQENFDSFTTTMQGYFIKYERRLYHFKFDYALKYMDDLLKRRSSKWLGDLLKILEIFKILIEEVILKKENFINQEIMQAAINKDEAFIESMANQKLLKDSQYNSMHFWTDAYFMNKNNGSLIEFIDNYEVGEFAKSFKDFLNYGNVESLLPVQELCLSYILSRNSSVFSVVGIGNGKTILCNILAAYLSKESHKQIIVMNKHECLSYRNGILFDQTFAKALNLTVGFDGRDKTLNYDVVFLCDNEMCKYFEENVKSKDDFILIMDEADQILFQEMPLKMSDKQLQAQKEKIIRFSKFNKIYAFSGTLTELEEECLQEIFDMEIVHFPKLSQIKPMVNSLILEAEFYHKEDWLKSVSLNSIAKSQEVPVLILVSQQQEKDILKQLKADTMNKLSVQSLINKNPIDVNNALKMMALRDQVNGYPIYLVDETLCRGLDIKTSNEIEEKNGLLVMIAKVPSTTKSFEQAKGRTQRLTNKGQHSIIVWNQTKKSFKQLMQDGDEKSQLNIRRLHQLLKVHSKGRKSTIGNNFPEPIITKEKEIIQQENDEEHKGIEQSQKPISLSYQHKQNVDGQGIRDMFSTYITMKDSVIEKEKSQSFEIISKQGFNSEQRNTIQDQQLDRDLQTSEKDLSQIVDKGMNLQSAGNLRQLRTRQAINYRYQFLDDDLKSTFNQKGKANKRRRVDALANQEEVEQPQLFMVDQLGLDMNKDQREIAMPSLPQVIQPKSQRSAQKCNNNKRKLKKTKNVQNDKTIDMIDQ